MNRIKPRIQVGFSMRLGHTRGRSAMTGGSGAVRSVARAKNITTDEYRVEQTIWVRKTGDAHATPFTTWSLDRMTRTEARRLAGMEDENTFGRTEPFAPAYLTKNNPPTLGMARPVRFLYANDQYSRKFAAGTEGEDISAETDGGTDTGSGTVPAIGGRPGGRFRPAQPARLGHPAGAERPRPQVPRRCSPRSRTSATRTTRGGATTRTTRWSCTTR